MKENKKLLLLYNTYMNWWQEGFTFAQKKQNMKWNNEQRTRRRRCEQQRRHRNNNNNNNKTKNFHCSGDVRGKLKIISFFYVFGNLYVRAVRRCAYVWRSFFSLLYMCAHISIKIFDSLVFFFLGRRYCCEFIVSLLRKWTLKCTDSVYTA